MEVTNELGVIVTFAREGYKAGFEIVSIQSEFPDAILRKGGQEYRAEFEFMAGNFTDHKHDVRECDIIICWENDFPDSILPVISLNDDNWANYEIALPSQADREIAYWKQRALTAERWAKVLTHQVNTDARKAGNVKKEKDKELPPRQEGGDDTGLTRRQRQVVAFLKKGMSNSDIAELLNVSTKTVSREKAALNGRLG